MQAILVREFGGPEVLKLEEIATPKPAVGQILVRIHAAGVNPYDTYMRAGTYAIKPPLPYTPGSDAAGVIEAMRHGTHGVRHCRHAEGHRSCQARRGASSFRSQQGGLSRRNPESDRRARRGHCS